MQSEVFAHVNPSPDAGTGQGSLAGKRVGVQSLFSVRGWPCTGGSKALDGFQPLEDATVVRLLKEAGAVFMGNTHVSELGLGIAEDTSAQAVAEGQVDVALMLDTLGEARTAAARAGLYGFKPGWGRISRFGLMGLAPSMECIALLAAAPEDLSRVYAAIAHVDERDPSMVEAQSPSIPEGGAPPRKVRRAGFNPELVARLTPGEQKAFSRAMLQLEQAGLTPVEVSLPDWDLFAPTHQVITAVEASSSCGKYDGVRFGHRASGAKNWNEMYLQTRKEAFGLLLKTFLFQGAYFQFENYQAFEDACRVRGRLIRMSEQLFADLEVLALPTLQDGRDATAVRDIASLYQAFTLTLTANVTGQPAVTIPGCLRTNGHQDIGLQLMGPQGSETALLALAQQISVQTEEVA
ncbi:amidase [Desulfobulbus alkaliphilus]|uniref:amidase n=1 Tax=Desulfobulbus alkaliphilus TaxID=869814 RepID=UPI001963004E|nr:amidase family protein [Desulfobulbus alkaliphilus]MBM9538317.1 hypothetical protein [Desulfobulbus alkaliphilus]